MIRTTFLLGVLIFLSGTCAAVVARASWLPVAKDVAKQIRLLACIYEDVVLRYCEEITPFSNWEVHTEQTRMDGGICYTFSFIAKQDMQDAGVAIVDNREKKVAHADATIMVQSLLV